MEYFKIYFLIFSFLLLGFIIRGITEKISIIIKMYIYNKKTWEIKNINNEINEEEKEELLNIIKKYK